jgi:hypothetical protein
MHLMIPFAGTVSEAGRHALQSLALPRLEAVLARLSPGPPLGRDEYSLNPPHEQALAQALGWATDPAALPDLALPWAAREAARLGLAGGAAGMDRAASAWGLLSPVHLHVGSEGVSLTDPAGLQLDAADSRVLLEAVRPLFETEGFTLHFAGAERWLATHGLFDGLATASLDRVSGRSVDPWLPEQRSARLLRRLQNEVQMLLYTHPINAAREAAGLPTVNSFWLSGCGRLPASATSEARAAPIVDDRLRQPALAEDWACWCEAWRALDAGPIADLARAGPGARLTLCGERRALGFEARPQGLWQRVSSTWRKPAANGVLEGL